MEEPMGLITPKKSTSTDEPFTPEDAAATLLAASRRTPSTTPRAKAVRTPSSAKSAKKLKRPRVDKAPERRKAPHIMTIYDKDLSMANVTEETSLYKGCRKWMENDPEGRHKKETSKQPTPLLRGFALPASKLTNHPQTSRRQPLTQIELSGHKKDVDEAINTENTEEIEVPLEFRKAIQGYKTKKSDMLQKMNAERAGSYEASLKIMRSDQQAPNVAIIAHLPT